MVWFSWFLFCFSIVVALTLYVVHTSNIGVGDTRDSVKAKVLDKFKTHPIRMWAVEAIMRASFIGMAFSITYPAWSRIFW